jgi:uncharacterized protein YeaC (DUF1315 family)
MEYEQLIDSLTPDVVARLRRGIETGRWPDGRPLTPEQREHSLPPIIAWEQRHLPEEQRTGYIDRGARVATAEMRDGPRHAALGGRRGRRMTRERRLAEGGLRKLQSALLAVALLQYELPCGEDQVVPLNALLGRTEPLRLLGEINCIHCGRKTKKSFNQGFCYPCFKRLAQCDSCIVKSREMPLPRGHLP